jgi:hypothetical protein
VTAQPHSQETIETALRSLANVGGSVRRAAKITGVPERTLRSWKNELYRDRYEQHASEVAQLIEDGAIVELRERITRASELEDRLLDELERKLRKGEVRDPAAAAQRLAVIKGINVDKLLKLTGRPTVVHEHRNYVELVESLRRRGLVDVIEGEAQEIRPKVLTQD